MEIYVVVYSQMTAHRLVKAFTDKAEALAYINDTKAMLKKRYTDAGITKTDKQLHYDLGYSIEVVELSVKKGE
jgi:hypothetical protein